MQVEAGDDGYIWAYNCTNTAQDLALAVLMALGDHCAMQVEIDRVDAALQRSDTIDDLADHMLEGLVGDMGAWLRGGPGDGMQRPFLLFRFGDEAADRDVHRLEARVHRRALGQRRHERKSVAEGKRVSVRVGLGGGRIIKK